jgi:hypothetical protein
MNVGKLWGREPAMFVAVVQTILALGVAFGLNLTAVQTGAILAATSALLGLVTRSQVTPNGSIPLGGSARAYAERDTP